MASAEVTAKPELQSLDGVKGTYQRQHAMYSNFLYTVSRFFGSAMIAISGRMTIMQFNMTMAYVMMACVAGPVCVSSLHQDHVL